MDCFDECPFLCTELEIQRQLVTTRWPDKASIIPFYDEYVVGHPYEEHFSVYKTIKAKAQNISEQQQAIEMLHQTSLIEDNFAQVDLYLGSTKLVQMTDHAKYSTTDLFSNLGGTLNLYSGITFVIVIELFELLFLIFYNIKKEKEKKKKNNKNMVIPIKQDAFGQTQYSKGQDFEQRYW